MIRNLPNILMLSLACLATACSNPAVSKAVGTGSEGEPIRVVPSAAESSVTIDNHAGRPLLNVRVSVDVNEDQGPFVLVVPTIDAGASATVSLTTFRNDSGPLDPSAVHPKQVT